MDKFAATGMVSNKKVIAPVENEAVKVTVLGHVPMGNKQSIEAVSQASDISRSDVHRIVGKLRVNNYRNAPNCSLTFQTMSL